MVMQEGGMLLFVFAGIYSTFKFSTVRSFDLHPEFYNKSILLTEEELANPMIVLQQFFEDYHLIEARKHLHSLLEVAITSSNDMYAEASERDSVVYFCERVEKVIEIIWVINAINV